MYLDLKKAVLYMLGLKLVGSNVVQFNVDT